MSEEESRSWRPTIGMVQSTRRAGLDPAGHRTLGHYGFDRNDSRRDNSRAGQGQYSNMGPPGGYYNNGRYRSNEEGQDRNRQRPPQGIYH